MGDDKQTDDVQSDLSQATESLKIESEQKDGDSSKGDNKVKSKTIDNNIKVKYKHCVHISQTDSTSSYRV